ncbi:nSTAND1 domain-containing NTPase [Chryseobacterium lacus]|uniref:nSTAND1 domain-containing NTPase n=1 Tax=Chryseobacterium lacus TaxID=2058346 RepID=UPI000F880BE4|nr:ATP-binding protein [Chryseobacterium lacus]RST27416.1 ATP-binding protein [Chryseobacterium lacus]
MNEKILLLNKVFSPSSPIKKSDFFSGRITQIDKICDVINEDGQHAIVYGERGVGKTSFANIISESLTNVYPIKITCNKNDTFHTLWKQAFNQIQFSKTVAGLGFKPEIKKELVNFGQTLDVNSDYFNNDIINCLNTIPNKFLFIFDEFDNIEDSKTKSNFADLIKAFSDNNINTTIVIVGIADDIVDLIGSHPSLERCLKQIKMPRMSDKESEEIIIKGLSKLELTISESIKNKIIEFSSGFPHYIHLLCKYGAKELIENERKDFGEAYLTIAIRKGIENTNENLKSSFRVATINNSTSEKWMYILYACALSPLDKYNCFERAKIVELYNVITRKKVNGNALSYNLKQLCTSERGDILQKIGKGLHSRYRFTNPMMRAYIKLKINSI